MFNIISTDIQFCRYASVSLFQGAPWKLASHFVHVEGEAETDNGTSADTSEHISAYRCPLVDESVRKQAK